jgi:predicted metal-dependent hydrolase
MAGRITEQIEGIGSVTFIRSAHAKHIRISIKPFKGIQVSVPPAVPLQKAFQFVNSKRNWILKHLLSVKKYEEQAVKAAKKNETIDPALAKQQLTFLLQELAKRFGFSYNKVSIRNQKTRWGSCSHNNNISLNRKILRLPDKLQEYILLHELVHTCIKDHSVKFWQKLEKILPQARKLNKELKKYHIYIL